MDIENSRMSEIYNYSYIDSPKEYFKECANLLPPFDSLLDIGCSNGSFLNYIKSIYPNSELYGIDSNDYTSEKKSFHFIKGDFTKDTIHIKVDIVTCMGVLSGYDNILDFFNKLKSFLKPNGTILMFDNVNQINLDFNIKYRKNQNFTQEFVDKYYSYWYSKKTFFDIAKSLNMNIQIIPFNIPFEIAKNDDVGRAYTKQIDGKYEQFVYNDFPLHFHFIKYSQRMKPIMFHHFHHDGSCFSIKGSFSADKFESLIQNIGRNNILDFDKWIEKYESNTLNDNETCFTFDDGLKCQYDIVLPILKKYQIKACWSIISSTLTSGNLAIESLKYILNRYFYGKEYVFYDLFKTFFNKKYDLIKAENYRKDIEFYSKEEREFRYIRDLLLTNEELKHFVQSFNNEVPRLFINSNELKDIIGSQQFISNHSHNHRTDLTKMTLSEYYDEFQKCNDILSKFSCGINYLTLPCGICDEKIRKVTEKLNISYILGINDHIQRSDCNHFI